MVDNKNKFKHVRFFLFFFVVKSVRVDFFFFDNIFEIFCISVSVGGESANSLGLESPKGDCELSTSFLGSLMNNVQ